MRLFTILYFPVSSHTEFDDYKTSTSILHQSFRKVFANHQFNANYYFVRMNVVLFLDRLVMVLYITVELSYGLFDRVNLKYHLQLFIDLN